MDERRGPAWAAHWPHRGGHRQRSAGPGRRPLSLDAIVEATLKVIDADGVDAVTMRRVAHELGTGAASLYAHISDKSELLSAALDRVLGQIDVDIEPDPRRWQEQLVEFARRYRAALIQHRDLARVNLGDVPTGPNALRGMETVLSVLEGSGLPVKLVGYAADLLAQFVAVSAFEDSLYRARLGSGDAMERWHEQMREFLAVLPADRYPVLRRVAGDLFAEAEPDDARFEFGLHVLVGGLAALVTAKPGGAVASRRRRRAGAAEG